jgi:hypothetical protein
MFRGFSMEYGLGCKMGKPVKLFLSLLVTILLSVMVGEGVTPAALPVGTGRALPHALTVSFPGERNDVKRIISVLEQRIGSHRLPVQAKDKLAVIPQKDLRLISALCDRIEATDGRAGTDLAVLLAAALIVLS